MAEDIKYPSVQEIDEQFKKASEEPTAAVPPESTIQAQTDTLLSKAPQTPTANPQPISSEASSDHPASPATHVNVLNNEGQLVSIPKERLRDALNQGFVEASDDDVKRYQNDQKYGGASQQILGGLEGALETSTFGLSTGLERGIGKLTGNEELTPEAIQGRRETGSGHAAGELIGLGAGLLTGSAEAALLEKAGAKATKALGLGTATTTFDKIGSAAVKGAVENALFQGGSEVSKMLSAKDMEQLKGTAEGTMGNIGLSSILGGTFGAGFGSLGPLWDATIGSKAGSTLKKIISKAGGVEGQDVVNESLNKTIDDSGLNLKPEYRAALSDDPVYQEYHSILSQSDNSASGVAYKRGFKENVQEQADSLLAKNLGHDINSLSKVESLSENEVGKEVGELLAKERDEAMEPITKNLNDRRELYGKKIELQRPTAEKLEVLDGETNKISKAIERQTKLVKKLTASGDVEAAVQATAQLEDMNLTVKEIQRAATRPGVADEIINSVSKLAQEQGWSNFPDSSIMKGVNGVLKALPNLKTLDDLAIMTKNIREQFPFNPMDGSLYNAGRQIIGIVKDAEADVLERAVGKEEGAIAQGVFKNARQDYAKQAAVSNELEKTLHAKGGVSSYSKAVREMTRVDAETLLRRLSDKKDVALASLLEEHFPKTLERIKKYQLDSIVKKAMNSKRDNFYTSVLNQVKELTPEYRNTLFNADQQKRIAAIGDLMEKFNDANKNYNFSNTARTTSKLNKYGMPVLMGTLTALITHNPIGSVMATTLTNALRYDAPDATRLALMKLMGSKTSPNIAGFRHMVEFIDKAQSAESMTKRAINSIFSTTSKVIPQSFMPSESKRNKLDKYISKVQENPDALTKVGGDTGHYLPDVASHMAGTTANAVQYLSSIKPSTTPQAPLDPKRVPTATETAKYNNALDIAEAPVSVLQKIKDGNLSLADVNTLRTIYPNLYNKLASQVSVEMSNAKDKGNSIPYKTKLSLSLFLSQPLDSTMTPSAIINAQPKARANEADMMPKNGGPGINQGQAKALNKLANNAQTPAQAREAEKAMGK